MSRFVLNPRVERGPISAISTLFTAEECRRARDEIAQWPGYGITPLKSLDELAAAAGVRSIHYKDEAYRLGLKSFKALGGAYALYRHLAREIERLTGSMEVTVADLLSGRFRDVTANLTVASATAGNHGRSVAWGAQLFGCRCVIFIHSGVSDSRGKAIAAYGAEVVRVEGDYDHSVRHAGEHAQRHGWTVISDTSYPGYEETPRLVMLGYTVMMSEIEDALDQRPTHIFVQGGVGGLAGAVAAFEALNPLSRPRLIVVEPEEADCLYQSCLAGQPAHASGSIQTFLLGMACGEVSHIAWRTLDRFADAFVTISDAQALDAMKDLNDGTDIVAGECAGAGLAALRAVMASSEAREALELGPQSRILLIGTEGATDEETYKELLNGKLPHRTAFDSK